MLSEESVVKIYDRWGSIYDIIFKHIFEEGRGVGVQMLDLKPGEHLLEVGVGTGLSLPLYPRHAEITGIDISSKMLEKARKKVAESGLHNIQLRVMDAQAMEFPDNSFDCITIAFGLRNVTDKDAALRSMTRVLKPGGRLMVSDMVLMEVLPEEQAVGTANWVACLAGTELKAVYLGRIADAGFVERVEDSPDAAIHPVHHCGVRLHASFLTFPFGGGQGFPIGNVVVVTVVAFLIFFG